MSNDVTRAPFIRPRSRTLSDLLGELAERRGDATAVVHADGATTFGALHARALAVATALRSLGYAHITLLDISPVAVAALRARHAGDGAFDVVVGDMCALPLPDQAVDLVLDKAALDTLLCAAAR